MERFLWIVFALTVSAVALMPGAISCGGNDGGCPRGGKLCNDCSASGNCSIDPCPVGQVNFCGNFGLVASDLRCSFCAPPDYQP